MSRILDKNKFIKSDFSFSKHKPEISWSLQAVNISGGSIMWSLSDLNSTHIFGLDQTNSNFTCAIWFWGKNKFMCSIVISTNVNFSSIFTLDAVYSNKTFVSIKGNGSFEINRTNVFAFNFHTLIEPLCVASIGELLDGVHKLKVQERWLERE